MAPFQMINALFKHGLGELHVLHFDKGNLVFGHIVLKREDWLLKITTCYPGLKQRNLHLAGKAECLVLFV